MGWAGEAGRGSRGHWRASCRDWDLLRSGEPVGLRDSLFLEAEAPAEQPELGRDGGGR